MWYDQPVSICTKCGHRDTDHADEQDCMVDGCLCSPFDSRPSPGPAIAGLGGGRVNERPAEAIARRFHEEYEYTAPLYGWTTQEASRVEWDDLPDNQRKLMVHVVGNLLAAGVITVPRACCVDTECADQEFPHPPHSDKRRPAPWVSVGNRANP